MAKFFKWEQPADAMARPRLFYGWVVAAALAVMTSASVSGSYTLGLCLRPIGEQYGFDRASLALAVTLYTFIAGLLQPIAGYLADRFGSRQMGVAGVTMIGIGLLGLSYARSLLAIYLSYGVVAGLGASLIAGGVSAKIVSAWFVRRRGTAMSLAGSSAIVAQLLIVPLAAFVLSISNWQTADRVVAGLILLVVVPMTWSMVRNHPSEKGLHVDGDARVAAREAMADRAGLSLREAMRHPSYWLLMLGLVTCGVTMSFPSSHLMAFAADMHMPEMAASETIGLAGVLSLPGSLALGFLGDRSSRPRMLAVAYGLRAVTYLILLQARDPQVMLAAGVALGLSWGATVPLTSAIVADLFGRKSIATIVTTMTMIMWMASGIFSYLAGLDFSQLGSYDLSLIAAAALGLVACIGCLLIPSSREPASPIREPALAY
jgi:MFS family permease